MLLLTPELVLAQSGLFPRGPGFYFSPYKLLIVAGIYLLWIKLCWWVNEDAEKLNLPAEQWNSGVFAGGVLGLLLVWALPVFLFSFLLLLLFAVGPTLAYVYIRNQKVGDAEQVLTRPASSPTGPEVSQGQAPAEEEARGSEKAIPMRFFGKSTPAGIDAVNRASRVRRGIGPPWRWFTRPWNCAAPTSTWSRPRRKWPSATASTASCRTASPFTRQMGDAVINIFKVLANMDITEKRKPQDGSFSGEVTDRPRPRPATVQHDRFPRGHRRQRGRRETGHAHPRPCQTGRRAGPASACARRCGSRSHDIVTQPHGMFIVCGPTGAGKSTTLYACLGEIDCFQRNVITIENPVEYQMANVTQIEVNVKAGKTFASELRSILRQDPDVIYIGEIRDQETAEIACQAAQTGHMVLTTLHANDTVTAVGRLLDLGVQPFMVANAVSAVLGQRLVRVLCPKCKQKYKPNAELLRKANLPADKIKYFYRPPGSEGRSGGPGLCVLRRHRLPGPQRSLRAAGAQREDPRNDPRQPQPDRHPSGSGQGWDEVSPGRWPAHRDRGRDLDPGIAACLQVNRVSPLAA